MFVLEIVGYSTVHPVLCVMRALILVDGFPVFNARGAVGKRTPDVGLVCFFVLNFDTGLCTLEIALQ